jgi:uncharacterized protein (TIGR02145 family)
MKKLKLKMIARILILGISLAFVISCKKEDGNSISDIDGNQYNTINIGTQVWLAENLNVSKLNDGTIIPIISNQDDWNNLTTSGSCFYGNDIENSGVNGRLYNWYAVNTAKLCPVGWHVPYDDEWNTLEEFLINNSYNYDNATSGNKIAKSLGSANSWYLSNVTGAVGNTDFPSKRDTTGFNGLPSGYRLLANFYNITCYAKWWSTLVYDTDRSWSRGLCWSNSDLIREVDNKISGLSVRCVKN